MAAQYNKEQGRNQKFITGGGGSIQCTGDTVYSTKAFKKF